MAKFPLDLSKFKKIASNGRNTILIHPSGHKFILSHKGMSKELLDQVHALPFHTNDSKRQKSEKLPSTASLSQEKLNPSMAAQPMADGGKVQDVDLDNPRDPILSPPEQKAPEVTPPNQIQADPFPGAVDQGLTGESETGSVPVGAPAPQKPESSLQQLAPQSAPLSPDTAATPRVNDPYGTEAYYNAYEQGIGEQKAGLGLQAEAEADQAKREQAMLQDINHQQQQNLNNYQQHFSQLNQERQNFMDDINNQHIDPNHYMGSLSTAGRLQTAIGLIAGGMGGAFGGGNSALQFLNNQIDRDINAQKANLGVKQTLLEANMRQFGNMRDALDMTRVMQMDMVGNQLKQAAAQAQSPLAKARLLQAAGQIDQQAAPVLSQIAMRKTLLGGMQSGRVQPSQVIRMIVPPAQQTQAYKELQTAQNMGNTRDNLLSAFDQAAKINTVAHRIGNPLQAGRQIHAILDPLFTQLSKDSAGRVTPQDIEMLSRFTPQAGDTAETTAVKRAQLAKFVAEKMHFPMLDAYGINAEASKRYLPNGQPRFQAAPPVGR